MKKFNFLKSLTTILLLGGGARRAELLYVL